ncbi:CBASS oligonucleotide cyclase [Phycicoccus flavus]|uniref:CBASS oligonucleotide cyclase n=1 Tax=Phycicoccus flavus TaxID=2502783 RepID=UPI000FEBC86D|nr:CBASS oligonucleotide cyclase [Phycicoccus flavus]NHA67472.1 nucleotidyltransferase [Phycicoccus flavus]
MGGSGGGRGESYIRPEDDLATVRAEIHQQLQEQEAQAEVNALLSELLAGVNSRDSELTRQRLKALQDALADFAIDVDRLLFGGSVAKHTYVDGLSDVDALVVVNDPSARPSDLVQRFEEALIRRLSIGDISSITRGNLAVTITYRDGAQVQLLPAVERDGHTSVPSWSGQEWRRIRPHKFAEKLTEVNASNGGAVVPTIKLAKALIQNAVPSDSRLGGYHVEAIAVSAFGSYTGRRDRDSMLKHLIGACAEAVLRPTGDITGQSVHIDDHLGDARSPARRKVSAAFARLKGQLESARSAAHYRELFGVV